MILLLNRQCVWMSPEFRGQTCLAPSLKLLRLLRRKSVRKRRRRAHWRGFWQLYLRIGFCLFYNAGSHIDQWLSSTYFAGNAEFAPEISGNDDVSSGVGTDWPLKGRRIVVTRSLVPLAGGPSMMSPRLPTKKSQQRVAGAGVWWW